VVERLEALVGLVEDLGRGPQADGLAVGTEESDQGRRGSPARLLQEGGRLLHGLATAFERDFSGSKPPHSEYPEEVEAWVSEMLALPPTAFYDHWFFQHPDGRRNIGYKAGAYVVDKAMAASGRSSADLVLASADEILELAGYGN
jgi:hypothetical protein